MLIYVATYPRCGNSWLRLIIGQNWRYLTSDYYPDDWDKFKRFTAKYGLDDDGAALAPDAPAPLAAWLARYGVPGRTRDRIMLRAAAPFKVFVKTHEMPPADPLPGERAVQMVRHPGAALLSFCRLERNFGRHNEGEEPKLIYFLRGQTAYGDWSEYHEAWGRTAMPVHRVTFEDAHLDEKAVATGIGEALGLEGPPTQFDFFAARHAAAPLRYPSGSVDAWLESYNDADLALLEERHGKQMRAFGYSVARAA